MATHLAALGVMSYQVFGGRSVTFPGDSTVRIKGTHVPTADGRSVKYVEWTVSVSGWLFNSDLSSASGTVDDAFDRLKEILSQSGGILTMTGKGFGDIAVNLNSGINRDVRFGPRPRVITWEPFGNITVKFEWEVIVCLPFKKGVSLTDKALDFTWETDYAYDAAGFCTRTISGVFDIVGSRLFQQSQVSSKFHIEQYINDTLMVDCPLGFHRLQHTIKISSDKSSATFMFVDEADKGLTMPPGIADMDVEHDMATQAEKGAISAWIWTFSAWAIPDARYGTAYGYSACKEAFQQRFNYMIRNTVNSFGVIIPIPSYIKASESGKSRRSTLVAAWVIRATGSDNGTFLPHDILKRSGMWQPFDWTAQDYKRVADAPSGPNRTGGFSGLVSDPSQNIIIDISGLAPKFPDPGKVQRGKYKLQSPPGENELVVQPFGQYLQFDIWVDVKTEGDQWISYPIAKRADIENIDIGGNRGIRAQTIQDKYSQYVVWGYIARCGMPAATIPVVKKVFGQECVTPAGQQIAVKTRPGVNMLGMVVWQTYFRIPLTPKKMDTGDPKNPIPNHGGGVVSGKPPGNTVLKKVDNGNNWEEVEINSQKK